MEEGRRWGRRYKEGDFGDFKGDWTLHEEKGEEKYLRRGTTQGGEYL